MDNGEINTLKRQGTRVFKKASPKGKFTVYLGKRDFVDYISHIDPIDGVILIDPNYVNGKKVFGRVLAAFKYGREDLDVIGLTFKKDLYLTTKQIYPSTDSRERNISRLQRRLLKQLGENAYPFNFELPPSCPASVTLQPVPGISGKPCGIDYELIIYIGETDVEQPQKRNSVRLAIRKIMYAPSALNEQPIVEVSKSYLLSANKLYLEVSLDKKLYHHGENIFVNVHIINHCNHSVKKIKVYVRQFADICLFSAAQYKCKIAQVKSVEGCPLDPGYTLSKVFSLTPLFANNKHKLGLALDGQLKHEDTNLASSTLLPEFAQRENLGIIVQYKVKVKLCMGFPASDLTAELPFILMHPKPEEEEKTVPIVPEVVQSVDISEDINLIQLDSETDTDDLIFEDFARERLKNEHNLTSLIM